MPPPTGLIAYWNFDTSGIETFYLINNTDSLYPKLTPLPYPKAGTIIPTRVSPSKSTELKLYISAEIEWSTIR